VRTYIEHYPTDHVHALAASYGSFLTDKEWEDWVRLSEDRLQNVRYLLRGCLIELRRRYLEA
jgi:hypothetical protein